MSRIHAWLSLAIMVVALATSSLSNAQTTRLEENDPAISYLGSNWYDIPDASLSGGNSRGAFQNGSALTVTFNGTGLTWIGYRCACAAGIARVYLDGQLLDTIDTYAATPEAQAEIYSVEDLAAGEHQFTIQVTGNYHSAGSSAYILIDAFDIEGSGGTPPTDTVDPEVTLTAPADGAMVSGAILVTADASDATWVQNVRLLVDGVQVGSPDSAAPYVIGWSTDSFPDGSHKLTVVATDAAGNMAEDSIDVEVANGGYLEENHPSVSYTGEWYDLNAPDVSGGSVVGTFHAGATASVDFNGTGIKWIGYRCVCAAGIATVYVDGDLVATVDTYAPERVPRAEIFSMDGLPAGDHVLKIEHTGNYHSLGDSAYLIVDAFRVTNGTGGGSDEDTTPPLVRLTAPPNTPLSGVVTVSADAEDDTGVVGVQFLLDGAPLGAEDLTAPYSISWDTTTAAEGAHIVTARARDEADNLGEVFYPPYMNVDNTPSTETIPPTVSFDGPPTGTTVVGGTTTLTATATDNVGVARVMFMNDGLLAGQDTTAPFSITWSTQDLADGGYTLRAIAFDHDGNSITSPVHFLNIWNSAAPTPTARIRVPTNEATMSGTITISIDAFHPSGIDYVSWSAQLYDGSGGSNDDGGGNGGTTTPHDFTWNTTNAPDGTYRIWGIVRGNDGTFIYSPHVRVNIDN